ncbi:hypothetical protein [Helicobacter macacae]|uniref:Uncharacterized protein n=1 Tax=Helicobacter macacae MIT 99-5501 TaxID=1357400 RepID=V8C7L3_9HELI|nr:hypothetical protein [Helicobacter macacae]ETD23000.1 hypothetical protein HMPREF2086_01447 [Helicobacter macacae MIT 99-5501]
MCILCGELVSSFHWSDISFGSDMNLAGQKSSVNENAFSRKRARLKRVKLLNEILRFYGLKIDDWQGSKFVLCDKKGQSVIVNDLGDLWDKAKDLAKREIDALDSNLLAFLGESNLNRESVANFSAKRKSTHLN